MTNENEVNAANNNDGNVARDDLRSEQPTESEQSGEVLQFPISIAAPAKRKRGRPRKESPPTRNASRDWAKNWAALSEDEKARLLDLQNDALTLQVRMNFVIADDSTDAESTYGDVKEFLAVHPLVDWWMPAGGVVDRLSPKAWTRCDDMVLRDLGLRTRISKLAFRVFLCHVIADHAAEVQPETLEMIKHERAELEPPEEPKFVADPVTFMPERQREERIRQRELLEEEQSRAHAQLDRWRLEQIHGVGNV